MTATPEQKARLNGLLAKLVPIFDEAAMWTELGLKRPFYEKPSDALLVVASCYGLNQPYALDAFNAFIAATSDVWNKWHPLRTAQALRDAADSFAAQLRDGT